MRRSDPGPVVLVIRDGWGCDENREADPHARGNAIALADTPVGDRLLRACPWNLLDCSGEVVGLPAGQMGNSEVGHLNLGAGRVVDQDITRISKAIREGEFARNPAFAGLIDRVKQGDGRLHLLGLCSDGGVHSHIDHLHALIDLGAAAGVPMVVHCITDGRDTSPTSGRDFVASIADHLARVADGNIGAIGTISGRYYTMDRDKRWERTEKAYRAIVSGEGETAEDPVLALEAYYAAGTTDEFLPPTVITGKATGKSTGEATGKTGYRGLRPEDGVIFFNFRADRTRQLTKALLGREGVPFACGPLSGDHLVTMTQYEDEPTNPVAFPPQHL
ncbi:MAG TPA: 2,3-bisphosphoglycerate-independent phosphoglycerate mutase, partial [Thermoanaerobaculia bacterium]|nr:2,3-bisphosphoglycerate-independent phosphoglycerate mutase [Thermoanaerobaculia bacterium]